MYAPKFRSWMSDWERFEEGFHARIDAQAAEAIAEIRAMAKAATEAILPAHPATETLQALDSLLANWLYNPHLNPHLNMGMQGAAPFSSMFGGIGGAFQPSYAQGWIYP